MTPLVRPAPLGGTSLVRDYLAGEPAALQFYGGSPFDLQSFRGKLAEVQRRFGRTERERAAAALRPASDAARERLARFVEQGGAMVTTGQQAGFLTGPLYTVYKALSAVALAEHIEQRLGILVIPVFWVASEDHDWEEVNHAFLLDSRRRLVRFEIPGTNPHSLPMSEFRLPEGLDKLCDDISHIIGGDGITDDLSRGVIAPYREAGRSVAGAFREALENLLGEFDLCFADAADPAIKEASRPILAEAIEACEAHEGTLVERSRSLIEAGYGSQVSILEGGVNVFLHGEGGRERLYRRGSGLAVRERKGLLERARVLEKLVAEPGRFSPNVLLRPVVESSVFPTLAYVGGPGEIGYFAQVTALFDAYGIAPPVVVPRFAGIVVESRTEALMGELGIGWADLGESRDILRDRVVRGRIPARVEEALRAIRASWVDGFVGLSEASEEVDPTLVGALGAVRNRGLLEVARAERKIVRALKRLERIPLERLDRVLDSLRPRGSPQDRVLNVLSFLPRYGRHFLEEVRSTLRAHWRLPEDS